MLTAEDEAYDAARLLCGELDGLLVEHGFAPGQIGTRPGEASVVFCTPLADLHRRLPALAADRTDESPGACADLNVSVTLAGGVPRVASVDLDGRDLEALLRDVGRHDRVPRVLGRGRLELAEALPRLHDLLRAVLDRAASGEPPARTREEPA